MRNTDNKKWYSNKKMVGYDSVALISAFSCLHVQNKSGFLEGR